MPKLILASSSPRRKELLSILKIPFDIIVSEVDETIDINNDLSKEIEQLSYKKALAVFKDNSDNIVIGADTIVYIDNEVLGKPKNIIEAKEMLKKLQDNTHKVLTAVTIMAKDKVETFHEIAEVTFNKMSTEEIEEYINTNEPLDKAGAYAIQGDAAKFIKRIKGDYYTIVGLPLSEVYSRLKKYSL